MEPSRIKGKNNQKNLRNPPLKKEKQKKELLTSLEGRLQNR
jgi:hypothetical protein